jgi:DUF1365 family protein
MIAILDASISHARHRPRANRFCYRAAYFAIPAGDLREGRHGRLFSIDRPNLFALRTSDYGDGHLAPEARIRRILAEWNLPDADGEIVLLTLPRILGYVFNPVSFWFCFDANGRLRAVLADVCNTFGERHSYLCFHEDHRPIAPGDTLRTRKIFHVSPFIDVKGEYRFRFACSGDRIAVSIDLFDEAGLLLSTSIGGALRPLSDGALVRSLLGNPLLPLMVIGLIHWQALNLYLKRIGRFRKPLPPPVSTSG